MNGYQPEGLNFCSVENQEVLFSLSFLERAIDSGKILEAPVTLCDSDMNLHIKLGCCEGLMPKHEVVYMPDGAPVKDIAILTRVGKAICFQITDMKKNRDGKPIFILSRRLAQQKCTEEYLATLRPGDIIPACVTHMENFGAFVDIGCGIVSLLPIDAISVSRISHPKMRFSVGEEIKVVVRSIHDGRIYVSRKELLGTWEENASLFSVGQTVIGTVRSIESYGIFVELTPNLTGLAEVREGVKENDTAAVYIKSILPDKMKVKLVIIDSHQPQNVKSQANTVFPSVSAKIHIDRWRYSPTHAFRSIETDFTE